MAETLDPLTYAAFVAGGTARSLAEERAARATNRAHLAALHAVLADLARTNPEAVALAISKTYDAAFIARADQVGLAGLFTEGAAAVQLKLDATKQSTLAQLFG